MGLALEESLTVYNHVTLKSFRIRVRVWGDWGEVRKCVMDDLLSSFLSSATKTQPNSWLT